jgi:hypothetical protein
LEHAALYHCIDACFIGDETLEKLPEPSVVGKTRVGGVDLNRSRMRLAMRAIVALSTSPTGFTSGDVANKARALGGLSDNAYVSRQAAYDLKKLRGKQLIQRKGNSHRYEPLPDGLRAMAALITIRDDVIKPLLASRGRLKRGRPPTKTAPLDACYAALQHEMRALFQYLGIAA